MTDFRLIMLVLAGLMCGVTFLAYTEISNVQACEDPSNDPVVTNDYDVCLKLQRTIATSLSNLNAEHTEWYAVQTILQEHDPDLANRRNWERMHRSGWFCQSATDEAYGCMSWIKYD